MSEKAKIIDWFYRKQFEGGHLTFDNLLHEAASDALGKKPIDLDAYVCANNGRLWNGLMSQIAIDTKRGIWPLFVVIDRMSHKVIWYPFHREIEVKKRNRVLRICRSRSAFLNRFDTLTDREYEALGCVVAKLAGAKEESLTPAKNDSGIDFFARIVLSGRTHIFSGEGSSIRVVGQSKKYKTRVDVESVGTFLNTLNEVKNLAPNVKRLIPAWFIENPGPIVGWIVAHNGFQSGAEGKARNHGVILSSSVDLAEVAAKSRELDRLCKTTDKVDLLHDNVKRLLDQYGG